MRPETKPDDAGPAVEWIAEPFVERGTKDVSCAYAQGTLKNTLFLVYLEVLIMNSNLVLALSPNCLMGFRSSYGLLSVSVTDFRIPPPDGRSRCPANMTKEQKTAKNHLMRIRTRYTKKYLVFSVS